MLMVFYCQHGMPPTQSTRFNKSTKEGRGNTSAWTDTPSDRAQKAKMGCVLDCFALV